MLSHRLLLLAPLAGEAMVLVFRQYRTLELPPLGCSLIANGDCSQNGAFFRIRTHSTAQSRCCCDSSRPCWMVGWLDSTQKVYVATILSQHIRIDNQTIVAHGLIGTFLKGARWLRPLHVAHMPTWGSLLSPFEPLSGIYRKWLSLMAAFPLSIFLC